MTAAGYKKDTSAIVSPQDWQRAKGVLTLGAGLNANERTRLMETCFPDEPLLRTELLSMLDAHDKIKRALGPERTAAISLSESLQPTLPAASASEALVRIGAEYGPYRVIRLIGAGGMGQVFLAEDLRLGRRVALKSLAGRWLASPRARQRLLGEARTAAALSHPNIATLYDVLEDKGYLLLVMEYVEGRTADALRAEGPVPLGHAVRLAVQVCDALIYAHDRGIIHCDLKPSNLQVSPDGTAKVLDFGLARAKYEAYELNPDSPTPEVMLVGTPPYMPPERLRHGTLNVSGDLYSLGVTLFEMVTGRRPFDEREFAALTGAIMGTDAPLVSSLAPSSPACLDNVVARALAKDPKERHQTAREFSRELQDVLRVLDGDRTVTALASVPISRAAKPFSRPLLAAIAVVTAAVGLILTGFLTSNFYGSPLGLTTAFEGESAISWPTWGLRSLIVPLGQIAEALVVIGVASQLWRIALKRMFAVSGRPFERLRSTPAAAMAAGLLVAQVLTLRLLWWRFGDLFASINNFFLQSGSLDVLGSDYADEHKWYMRVFALVVLVFGWAWCRLLNPKSPTRENPNVGAWAVGGVIMVITFCFMVAPYRVFFQSRGERVSYQSKPCYLVGKKQNEAMLFCPTQSPPWSRLVTLGDPALERSGTIETIFPKSRKTQ